MGLDFVQMLLWPLKQPNPDINVFLEAMQAIERISRTAMNGLGGGKGSILIWKSVSVPNSVCNKLQIYDLK